MATELKMPALSPTMEEGTLAKWLKSEGEKIEIGDIIAEIETDKATMEFEAVDEGTIGKILIDAGTEGVKVNTPIAVLLEEGEDASDIDSASSAAPAEQTKADDSDDAKSDKAPAAAKPDAVAVAPKPASPTYRNSWLVPGSPTRGFAGEPPRSSSSPALSSSSPRHWTDDDVEAGGGASGGSASSSARSDCSGSCKAVSMLASALPYSSLRSARMRFRSRIASGLLAIGRWSPWASTRSMC